MENINSVIINISGNYYAVLSELVKYVRHSSYLMRFEALYCRQGYLLIDQKDLQTVFKF